MVITRNCDATLSACLDALRDFDEIVVYDNGSVDSTLDIARSFRNVSLHTGEFKGFGPTKNHAAGLARHGWVLSVDSDEYVSPELVGSIRHVDLADHSAVYAVRRRNYMLGGLVRHSGWGRDWLPRFYHRDRARYTASVVHERVTRDAGVTERRLAGDLHHEAVREIGDLLDKVNRYSELRRAEGGRTYPAGVIGLRAVWAFVRTYIVQGGVLDGWRGLVIAWSNANGVFFKYMKRYADRQRGRRSHDGS